MLTTVGCAAEWCGGRPLGRDLLLSGVAIDSRRAGPGDLFVALPGARVDGHDFIAAAEQQGAVAAMVTERQPGRAAQIIVDDCKAALAMLAGGWRRLFAGKVAAITGSNGKTTVKEMLASICRAAAGDAHAYHSAGNMNNALGASLSLLSLRAQHRYAVLETGMDAPGELTMLGKLCRPHVALINNAQRAHLGNFNNVAEIADAKGELLDGLPAGGIAVLNADDEHFERWQKRIGRVGNRRLLSFGFNEGADFTGKFDAEGLHLPGIKKPVRLKLPGIHNAKNALAAAAAAQALDLPLDAVVQGLETCTGAAGRLQYKTAKNSGGALVIDDTYNANPDSLAAALEVLSSYQGKKIAVLGDMLALGDSARHEHQAAAALAREKDILLLTTGEHFAAARGSCEHHYPDKASLIDFLQQTLQGGEQITVLVKGSRGMRMEEVVQALCGNGEGGN